MTAHDVRTVRNPATGNTFEVRSGIVTGDLETALVDGLAAAADDIDAARAARADAIRGALRAGLSHRRIAAAARVSLRSVADARRTGP